MWTQSSREMISPLVIHVSMEKKEPYGGQGAMQEENSGRKVFAHISQGLKGKELLKNHYKGVTWCFPGLEEASRVMDKQRATVLFLLKTLGKNVNI